MNVNIIRMGIRFNDSPRPISGSVLEVEESRRNLEDCRQHIEYSERESAFLKETIALRIWTEWKESRNLHAVDLVVC
jgi:hypothetical protein